MMRTSLCEAPQVWKVLCNGPGGTENSPVEKQQISAENMFLPYIEGVVTDMLLNIPFQNLGEAGVYRQILEELEKE